MNQQAGIPEEDTYSEVVSAIRKTAGSRVSVPKLSTLLGVKTTTLNARFRRQNIPVRTVGRTNFISQDVALHLAELHKYALIGWLTLKHASELTGVKSGTIKAWCESGQVEGHIDLTKRLRIAPSALQAISPMDGRGNKAGEPRGRARMPVESSPVSERRNASAKRNKARVSRPARAPVEDPLNGAEGMDLEWAAGYIGKVPAAHKPPQLSPPAAPSIRIITRKDYGLPELEETSELKVTTSTGSGNKPRKTGPLTYDPDRPFSVSDCAVGKRMRYGQYDGTILRVFDDPFNPHIQVFFPEQQDPLMREVHLIVGRRN